VLLISEIPILIFLLVDSNLVRRQFVGQILVFTDHLYFILNEFIIDFVFIYCLLPTVRVFGLADR
jgi:hypothetical protein